MARIETTRSTQSRGAPAVNRKGLVLSAVGSALILVPVLLLQLSGAERALDPSDFKEISVASFASPTPPNVAVLDTSNRFVQTYQGWSDELIVISYEAFWSQVQDLKITHNGAPLDSKQRDLLQDRFEALWTLMNHRGLTRQSSSPEPQVIRRFMEMSTERFLGNGGTRAL